MRDKILMCSPEYFDVKYKINPWMDTDSGCDREKAKEQWRTLKDILAHAGAEIKLIDPREDVPDMVFTANAALMYENKAIISNFKYKERKPEEQYFAQWFKENGYDVITLPETMSFEGAGDALLLNGKIFAGYVPRTDIVSHTLISELLGVQVVSLELATKSFYHIDTCFCPLSSGYLIYYPEAFDKYGNQVIEANVAEEKRIAVTEEEAACFSCNAVNVGKTVVTNLTTDRFAKLLESKGFSHIQTDLSEFIKSGGSAKCLTLKI